MKIVMISDTHNKHDAISVGSGDVLIHCGDFTDRGEYEQIAAFGDWMRQQDFEHKIVVAGNHDISFENTPKKARKALGYGMIYLQDSGVNIDGVSFWGSPWQPEFYQWGFNLPRNTGELYAKWKMIPDTTDVLITHGPPAGILDRCGEPFGGVAVGCAELHRRVSRLSLKIHCFGHIHAGYGREVVDGTEYINAASLDSYYRPVNSPQEVEL